MRPSSPSTPLSASPSTQVAAFIAKFDPEVVSAEVAALCKDYKIATVTGDAYGGEWPRDPLKKRGIGYVVSEKTRSARIT